MAVGGHFEDLSCRKKKHKSHYHVHVIVDVYVLLLLDHADAKFNVCKILATLQVFVAKNYILLISEFFSSSVKMSLKIHMYLF